MKNFYERWIECQIASQNWEVLLLRCLNLRMTYDEQDVLVRKYAESNEKIRKKILKCISALEVNPNSSLSPKVLLLLAEITPEEVLCKIANMCDNLYAVEAEAVKRLLPGKGDVICEYAEKKGLYIETQAGLVSLYRKSDADNALQREIIRILNVLVKASQKCFIDNDAMELVFRNKADLPLAEIRHDERIDMAVAQYCTPEEAVPYFKFYLKNRLRTGNGLFVAKMYRKFLNIPGTERDILIRFLSRLDASEELEVAKNDFELFLFMTKECSNNWINAIEYVFSLPEEAQNKFLSAYKESVLSVLPAADKVPTCLHMRYLPDNVLCRLLTICFQVNQNKSCLNHVREGLRERERQKGEKDCPMSWKLIRQTQRRVFWNNIVKRIKKL